MFSFFPPKIGSTNSVKFSLYFSIYAACFYFNPSTMSDSSLHLSIVFLTLLLFLLCFRQFLRFRKSEPTFASCSPIDSSFSSSSASSIVSPFRYMKVYAYVVAFFYYFSLSALPLSISSLVFPFLSNPYNYLEIRALLLLP